MGKNSRSAGERNPNTRRARGQACASVQRTNRIQTRRLFLRWAAGAERSKPAHLARPVGGSRRSYGGGKDHNRKFAAPVLRIYFGRNQNRRHGHSPVQTEVLARANKFRAPGNAAVSRNRGAEHCLRETAGIS